MHILPQSVRIAGGDRNAWYLVRWRNGKRGEVTTHGPLGRLVTEHVSGPPLGVVQGTLLQQGLRPSHPNLALGLWSGEATALKPGAGHSEHLGVTDSRRHATHRSHSWHAAVLKPAPKTVHIQSPVFFTAPGGLTLPFLYRPRGGKLKPAGQSGPRPAFINEVILGPSHAHLFMYCPWLFSHYRSRVEELQKRSYGPQNLKYVLSGPLRKSLPTLTSTDHDICKQEGGVFHKLSVWVPTNNTSALTRRISAITAVCQVQSTSVTSFNPYNNL